LSKSEKKYGDLDVNHKELRNRKDREIEGLQKKWEASQSTIAAVTSDLSVSQERYKSLETEHEELKRQHQELSQQHEELRQEHEKLRDTKDTEIAKLHSQLVSSLFFVLFLS
jgi:chromosome segregation ATPase